ncbi:hypothetical protein EDC96DRAFT_547657 [Choanephora cucurbitarum]|nr:hypothetical protein EDC96DRAFT_547657 [Choanephora cucurbitarum]
MSLRIPFVHARGERVYLWSLEICSEKLYTFQKIHESNVPLNWDDEDEILSLDALVWLLEKMLSNLVKNIDCIRKEHRKAKARSILGRKELEALRKHRSKNKCRRSSQRKGQQDEGNDTSVSPPAWSFSSEQG